MGLQKLLEPEVIFPAIIVAGLLNYVEGCTYKIFMNRYSFLEEDFADAKFWEKQIDSSADAREITIKKYQSLLDKKVPKHFMFTRPSFYFQIRRKFNSMREESKRKLQELKID